MPIAQLMELWKKIEVEPMEIEVSTEEGGGHFLTVPFGLWQMVLGSVEKHSQLSSDHWHGRDIDALYTCFTYVTM